MKLIIDIPDEQYGYIKRSDKNTFAAVSSKECMLHAIKNGTPISTDCDLISRSELKKAIENYLTKRQDVIIWEPDIFNMLDNAPTVSERPRGRWIFKNGKYRCSHCGEKAIYRFSGSCSIKQTELLTDFCWKCGADMRKENRS